MRRYDWGYAQPWDVPAPRPVRGYDRGVYGDNYPAYGGYPGAETRGLYYGRGAAGYDRGYARGGYDSAAYDRPGWGGYDRGYGPAGAPGGGYDGDFAREPFLPEQAYRRHPEYEQGPRRPWSRWDREESFDDLDDRQVLRNVQRSLYEDVWIDIDDIHLEVEDGVVTLTGEVADFMEARYAWDDAWESPGVRGVINNLTVRTDLPQDQVHGDLVPQTARGNRTEADLTGEAGGEGEAAGGDV